MCNCCITPCKRCTGSFDVGGDLNTGADLGSIITAKMAGLTDPGAALDLFSLGGTNGGTFTASAFWDEATKYFNKSA